MVPLNEIEGEKEKRKTERGGRRREEERKREGEIEMYSRNLNFRH